MIHTEYKLQQRIARLQRRYKALAIHTSNSKVSMGWFAAVHCLETCAATLESLGVATEWDTEPPTADDLQDAWQQVTPADVDALLAGQTVRKVHCLVCGG